MVTGGVGFVGGKEVPVVWPVLLCLLQDVKSKKVIRDRFKVIFMRFC